MNQKRPGRPTLGKFKVIIRNVSSDAEIEKFLEEHPEVNASYVFRNAIHSLMSEESKSTQDGGQRMQEINVYSIATQINKDFHIYKMALSESGFSYIQKILGDFQSVDENDMLDYIYYLYILLLLYYIIISFFLIFIATFFRIKEESE